MRSLTRRSFLVASIVSAVLVAGAVPAAAQSPAPIDALTTADTAVHFVGVTSDPDVYVAVVDHGDGGVNIYLCDGADVVAWLTGETVDGSLTAAGANGSTATATQDGETITGTVTLADGSTFDFSVTPAVPPAGLYERFFVHEGEPTQSRTIQLADGTAKGSSNAVRCDDLRKNWETMLDLSMTSANPVTVKTAKRLANGFVSAGRDAGCNWTSAL